MGIPVVDMATVGMGIIQFVYAFIPPARREIESQFNRIYPNQVPTVADAIDLRRKGYISEAAYAEYLRRQGWNPTLSDQFWKASHTLMSSEGLVILKMREEITAEQYFKEMKKLGYDSREATLFKKTYEFYPSPTDLVSWQAKEVFEPDAIEKYGLDNEYDLIQKEAFYKAGMSDEQIKNYWRAHWQHPPLSTVFDLLHRKLLDEEDVYEYYRLVEIPPYWRGMLTKLSYPPYTRVDTRRMYQMGVLSREEVFTNYQHLGYDDEKAENMTDFTVAFSVKKDKDLTRSQIEKAFEYGIITDLIAIELLKGLGYDEEESLFILGIKMYAMAQDELDDIVSTIKTRFRRGLITQSEALADLDKLEISATFRDKIVSEILRVKSSEFKLPSKTDLIAFKKQEIITKDEFINYMDRLGYQPTEIDLYVRSLEA